MVQQPLLCQSLLVVEASRSHSVGLLWTSDQPDAEILPHSHSLTTDRLPCPPVEFEPTSERPQTHVTAHSVIFTVMLYFRNFQSLFIVLLIILSYMLHVGQLIYRAILCCKCEKELRLCERSVFILGTRKLIKTSNHKT